MSVTEPTCMFMQHRFELPTSICEVGVEGVSVRLDIYAGECVYVHVEIRLGRLKGCVVGLLCRAIMTQTSFREPSLLDSYLPREIHHKPPPVCGVCNRDEGFLKTQMGHLSPPLPIHTQLRVEFISTGFGCRGDLMEVREKYSRAGRLAARAGGAR